MWVLGLLILLVVAVVTIAMLVRGGEPASIDLNTFVVKTTVMWVFLTGAATLLLAVIGLVLLTRGLKKSRSRRAEVRELRARAGGAPATPAGAPAASAPAATPRARDRDTSADDAGSRERGPMRPRTEGDADDYFDSAPRDH